MSADPITTGPLPDRAASGTRLSALLSHNVLLQARDPGHLISYLIMPMVLMLAFRPLYRGVGAGSDTQTVVGLTVMFSSLSLVVVGTAMLTERIWLTWDRMRMSPVAVVELLVGKTVPLFALLVVQQTLLFTFGVLAVGMHVDGPLWLVATTVLVWSFAVLSIGCALAVLVRSHGELSAISDVGALTLSALGGAFAPVALMPGWMQVIAPVSPGYWATSALRAGVEGDVGRALGSAGVLGLIGLAAGALACARVHRGLSQLRG